MHDGAKRYAGYSGIVTDVTHLVRSDMFPAGDRAATAMRSVPEADGGGGILPEMPWTKPLAPGGTGMVVSIGGFSKPCVTL